MGERQPGDGLPAVGEPGSGLIPSRLLAAQAGVLLLLATVSAGAYLTRHGLAVANTTIQEEIGINNQQFGYLYGAFSLGYLICQIPGGWLGQKLGARLTLPLLSGLWSIMTLATALVTTLWALIVVRFLFGLAQAGLVPNQAMVIKDWIPSSRRGIASSVMTISMAVGGMASMALTSWLMQFYHWRSVFIAYTSVGIVWATLFLIVFRPSPASVRWLQERSAEEDEDEDATVSVEHTSPPTSDEEDASLTFLRIAGSLSVWALISQGFFRAAGYNLLITFLPAIFEYAYQVPRSQTGHLASWALAALVLGSMFGGAIIDFVQHKTGSKYCSRSGVACVALTVTAALTFAAGCSGTATGLAALLAAAALFSSLASPAAWASTMDLGGKDTAVVMGTMNTFSALAGIAISPLVGRMIDWTHETGGNFSYVIWLHAGFYSLGAASWLLVRPDQPLSSPRGTPIHS
jgi:MFS family permease